MISIWTKRWSWITGSLLIFVAIIAEALQSHALEDVSADKISNYLTATRFMFFNGLGLIAVYLLLERHQSNLIRYSGILILAGTILFSSTVLVKVFADMNQWGWITPLGGMILMAGWLLMIIGAFRAKY